MLLDDLVKVIETLKERIDIYGHVLRENEIRTRVALIDPLLTAIGWNTADPASVRPEYNAGAGRADYGLLGSNGQLVASIEAKRLGESLENHEKQIFDYAWSLKVKYAGLTDGNRWYFVDISKIAENDRTILQVSLTNTSSHEAALKLLLLWRPNLSSGQPVEANAPVLVAPPDVPPDDPNSPGPAPEPAHSGNWISLSNVVAGKGQAPPKAIRFSKGQVRNIPSWRQVLVEVAEKLANDGTLTATHCPMKGLGFINSSPNSPGGASFRSYKTISGGLYVNLNWNSSNIIKHSRKLLSHFHLSPETVELQFD